MKVAGITPILLNNYSSSISKTYKNTKPMAYDSFESKTVRPSFGEYKVSKSKFNLIGPNDPYKTIGEVFREESETTLKEACDKRYNTFWGSREKANSAYKSLKYFVNDAKERYDKVNKDIDEILKREAVGKSNIGDEKVKLTKNFLSMLDVEQVNKTKIKINNGILIHGEAPVSDKNAFVSWINENVSTNKQDLFLGSSKTYDTMEEVREKLEYAEKIHELTNLRTLLTLRYVDDFLGDNGEELNSAKKEFLNLLKNASKKYHTTVLCVTDLPLNAINKEMREQIFDNQVYLNDGIRKDDSEKLKKLQAEKNRLDDAVKKVEEYYWYEYDFDYDDTYNNEPDPRDDWRDRM